jgi:hypothetical protein
MPEHEKPSLDAESLDHLLTWAQDGVVSRRQILELHGTDADIARMIRRRQLVVVHPGVYANHTGSLSWQQCAWAAVLYYWPAALTRESALPKPVTSGQIHLAVETRRTVRRLRGVTTHRTAGFEERVRWLKSPPRLTYEDAAIDAAAAKDNPAAAFTLFADACQTRETSAVKIAETLRGRARVRNRAVLLAMLDDLRTGACSVLERGYLDLERRHGLPTEDRRQVPASTDLKRAYRDVDHSDFGLVVELDGRPFHDNATARINDAKRDLATARSPVRRRRSGSPTDRCSRTAAGRSPRSPPCSPVAAGPSPSGPAPTAPRPSSKFPSTQCVRTST